MPRGLAVPESVFVTLDADLARTEPHAEVQDLIRRSAGLNVALDYLPGSISFDPLVRNGGRAHADHCSATRSDGGGVA